MLDTFGFPTPQGANYQEFYGGGTVRDWIKPRGASMARILLIGAGAGGRAGISSNGGAGGGSGAITQWIGPAIFIPDVLRVRLGAGGTSNGAGDDSFIIYQAKNGVGYTLLTALAGVNQTAGSASANNYFGAAGIYKSVAGQTGGAINTAITASTTTFLSGGAGGASGATTAGANVACNYGYPTITGGDGTTGGVGRDGFFLTQPIMIGVGGSGGGGSATTGGTGGRGGIGCGGGGGGIGTGIDGGAGGRGGDGAAFIWSW